MKYFLQMIDIANSGGIMIRRMSEDRPRVIPMDDDYAKIFESCQPVVFTSKNDIPEDMDALDESIPDTGFVKMELASPFKVFSYEMLNGPVCSPRIEEDIDVYVWCVVVVETGPNLFGFYALCSEGASKRMQVIQTNSFGKITQEFIARLNKEKVGTEITRTNVKIGTGKHKRQHRIRRVVYVCPKSKVESLQETKRNIDFSHRWLTRGHWRRIDDNSLGKNRTGDYVVQGHTWVTEHEKGPEHLPLINKTRVVIGDSNE